MKKQNNARLPSNIRVMEHVIKFRTALFETAAKEFKAFERSLREDFANRKTMTNTTQHDP